jgi:hypothetical protein
MSGDVMPVMAAAMAWLRANGIEPTDVPIREVPTIADGQITCRVMVRGRLGGRQLVNGEVATKTVTVPLKVKPPAVLLSWLGLPSECPNCGWSGDA